jgi:hypothetical protein
MASNSKMEIKKFNGKSFELWKLKMEDLLVERDQWIAVDPGTTPTGTSADDWKKMDRKAKSTIRLCLSDSVLLNVSEEATAKDLWEKLGKLYQSKSLVNKLFLRKKLYNLRMRDGDSVAEHLNAFNTVVSQLVSVDIKISDEDKCISLLCSLPDSWDSLVVAIGSNTTSLKFEEVVSSLLSEEMRRKNMEGHSTDALFARGRSHERNRSNFSSGRSKSKGRSKSPGKFRRVCWRCGKEGHYKKQCRSKVEKKKGSEESSSTEEKTSKEEGGDVYLASSSTHADHEAWLIDSGASFHMTPHREWFCEYEKYDGGNVFLGNDSTTRIIGKGRVKLRLIDGRIRTLPGVLHIPGMARNLISVSKMEDVGVRTIFEKGTCRMVRGAMVLMRGVRFGTLYKLLGSTISDECNSSIVPDIEVEEERTPTVSGEKAMLWHQRLGHIGEKGLRLLHGKGMVEGMSNCLCKEYNTYPTLMNAGATFQRSMDIAFIGEKEQFVVIYLDDITGFSGSDKEHCYHLRKVFSKCRRFGISLNPKKSLFSMMEGKLLGHIVSTEGVRIDPNRVEEIQTLSLPRSKKEVQAFL